jgi:hypothetical protein
MSELAIELGFWRDYARIKNPELERWEHLRNAALLLVPGLKKTYNLWFERCVKAYAGHSYIAALGCTTSTKIYSFHTLGYLDFMSDPENTQMICTTTSVKGLSERSWPTLTRLYNAQRPAGWVCKKSPRMIIQSGKGDPRHSIRAIAVQQKADEGEMVDKPRKILTNWS